MVTLPDNATMAEYQRYIEELEAKMGWDDVDLVHNCFLMGEEVGELFKAVRKHIRLFDQSEAPTDPSRTTTEAAEELVDVFNYLLAIANRMNIDLEDAFKRKNEKNQGRTWT